MRLDLETHRIRTFGLLDGRLLCSYDRLSAEELSAQGYFVGLAAYTLCWQQYASCGDCAPQVAAVLKQWMIEHPVSEGQVVYFDVES